MKIEQAQRAVEIEGLEDTQEIAFNIESSPLAFKILSDKLYSDKILAVIRELGCNAFDAHREANNEQTPFVVHLPNHFEPFFSIRDYGTGLSDVGVKKLYTTYFGSTKRDTNKAVGMLGLGSKSPFSYVDQFNVTSYYNGTRSIYVAYYNAAGVPSLKAVSSEPTDEANGLEIEMAVNPDDFHQFADRARKVFHRFPVLPTLKGNKEADLTQVKHTLAGPHYKVRSYDERYQYGQHRGAYAIQGVVAYPIDSDRISLDMTDKERSLIDDLPVDVLFEIGELDITPSREELSYDKRTQENILTRVREVLLHIPTHAETVLAAAPTLWEAKKLWHRWREDNEGEARFMKQVLDETLKWNGVDINNNFLTLTMYDKAATKLNSTAAAAQQPNGTLVPLIPVAEYGDVAVMTSKELSSDKKPRATYNSEVKISASDKSVIVWVDDEKIGRSIARYIHHTYYDDDITVFAIRPKPGFEKEIKDQLGGFTDFVLASSLEEPDGTSTSNYAPQRRELRKLYQVTRFSNGYGDGFDKIETSKDVSTGGVYMVCYNGKPITPGQEWEEFQAPRCPEHGKSEVKELLHRAQKLGLIPDEVYAFNSTHKNILKKHKGWENIFDVIKKNMKARLADKAFMSKFEDVVVFSTLVGSEQMHEVIKKYNHLADIKGLVISKNSRLVKLLDRLEQIGKNTEDFMMLHAGQSFTAMGRSYSSYGSINIGEMIQAFESGAKVFGTKDVETSRAKAKGQKLIDELKTFYPLLATGLQRNFSFDKDSGKEAVALYINLCDKGAGLSKAYQQKHLKQ